MTSAIPIPDLNFFSGLIFTSSSIAFITSRIASIFEWTSNLNTLRGITECGIENFQFTVWERAQGNLDNSRAMSALTLLLFKSNTLHKETLHRNLYILGKPDKLSKLLKTRKNTSTSLNETFKTRNLSFQNKYSPCSCLLGVFRNCKINNRINVCIWQICQTLSQPKPSCNDSGVSVRLSGNAQGCTENQQILMSPCSSDYWGRFAASPILSQAGILYR